MATLTVRPDPPRDVGEIDEGLEWRAVIEDEWSTDPELVAGKRCRYMLGGGRCPNAAVAVLWRPVYATRHPKRPWAYCADHLYGRWLEDGQVMTWNAVEVGS